MLVQALAEFADENLRAQLEEEAFEEKPVPFLLEIDTSGTFLTRTARNKSVTRGKKSITVPETLCIAKSPVPRNAGLHPLLAADDIKYLFGPGPWSPKDKDEKNVLDQHSAFIALLQKAAWETDDNALKACVLFYNRTDEVEKARAAFSDAKAGSLIALSVGGPVISTPAARDYWRTHYREEASDRVADTAIAECLISGKVGPIAPTHEKIKGLASMGGQASGVSLMSFDKSAFRSYGWEQNANSPVSPERAMAYTLALNELLRTGNNHRRDMPGVAFIFWTKQQADFDIMQSLDYANIDEIQQLLSLHQNADPDPNMFYMAGVSGNGGRMLIRYWVTEPLPSIKANLAGWFEGLRIANAFTGDVGDPPRLWELRRAIHREGEPPVDRTISLIRRAIEGLNQPLGHRMLAAALTRLRTGKDISNPARMGLIRLCLNDLQHISSRNRNEERKEPNYMSASLNPAESNPAYLCGRLLAVYESLQYSAHGGEVNNGVVDRYYSLASTYPALAFPKLEQLSLSHLKKLRRDRKGASVNIEKEIDSLLGSIADSAGYRFPQQLDLEDQGRFVLGYHHQRAQNMAQAQARKAKSQASNQTQSEEQPE